MRDLWDDLDLAGPLVAEDLFRTFGVFDDENHIKVTRLVPGPNSSRSGEPDWTERRTVLGNPGGLSSQAG